MKKLSVIFLIILPCCQLCAQWGEEQMAPKPSFRDRVFFGGGFGLSFGSASDHVSVSPLVGYKLTPRVATGVQIQYQYNNYKYISPSQSTSDYGASVFLRYNFYGPLFLHAEYEYLNYVYEIVGDTRKRDHFDSFMAGGGFFQPLGRNAGFYIMGLYNFNYRAGSPNEFSPYAEPWILRAGVTAGF